MYVLAWHSFDKAKQRMRKDFKQHTANYLKEADVTDPVEELHNLSATYKTDDGYILSYYIESVEES